MGGVCLHPLLSFAFPPASAIAIVLICELVIGAYLSWTVHQDVIPSAVGLLVISALVGQMIGIRVQNNWTRTPSVCALRPWLHFWPYACSPKNLLRLLWRKDPVWRWTGCRHASGAMGLGRQQRPPAVFYTASYFEKDKGRAVLITYLFIATFTLLGGFFQQGMVKQEVLGYSVVGVFVSLFAAYLGAKAVKHVSPTLFNRGVAVLLFFVAGGLLAVFG